MQPENEKRFGERTIQPLNEEGVLKELSQTQPVAPTTQPEPQLQQAPLEAPPQQTPTPVAPTNQPQPQQLPPPSQQAPTYTPAPHPNIIVNPINLEGEALPDSTKWWVKGIIGAAIALGGVIILRILEYIVSYIFGFIHTVESSFYFNYTIIVEIVALIVSIKIARIALNDVRFVEYKTAYTAGVLVFSYGLAELATSVQVALFPSASVPSLYSTLISPIYLYATLFGFLSSLLFLLFVDKLGEKLPDIVLLLAVLVIAYVPFTLFPVAQKFANDIYTNREKAAEEKKANQNPNWPALPTGSTNGFDKTAELCNTGYTWTASGSATCNLVCPYKVTSYKRPTCLTASYLSGQKAEYLSSILATESSTACDVDLLEDSLQRYGSSSSYTPSTIGTPKALCEKLTTPAGRNLYHQVSVDSYGPNREQKYYFTLDDSVTVLNVNYPFDYDQTNQSTQDPWMTSLMQYVDSFKTFKDKRMPQPIVQKTY